MSRNHAKAYAKEYGKRIGWAIDDTAAYITPEIVIDAAWAISEINDPEHKKYKSTSQLKDEYEKGRSNVRKWFKMVWDWVKSAVKKAKDYLNWDSSSASSTVHHMRARAKFKWKK